MENEKFELTESNWFAIVISYYDEIPDSDELGVWSYEESERGETHFTDKFSLADPRYEELFNACLGAVFGVSRPAVLVCSNVK